MPRLKSDRLSRESVINLNTDNTHNLMMLNLMAGDYFVVPGKDDKVRQVTRASRPVGSTITYIVITTGVFYTVGSAASDSYGIKSTTSVRRLIPTRMDFQWED